MTGMLVNQIGQLDVDIVLDEGPDQVTVMQDTYDTISQALPAVAKLLSPAQVTAAMDILIDTSPLPEDAKKKFRDASAQPPQPPPEQMAAQAKLQADAQMGQQKLQLDAAKMQQDGQLKRESAVIDAQTEREKATAQIEIERQKAANQMQIEQERANHQVQLELFKAQHQAQMAREKTAADNEMEAQRMNFRSNQEQQIRQATGYTRSPDDMLAAMMEAIGQSHQGLVAALSRPRKAVFHRDPRTGKVIGGMSVLTEE